MREETFPQPLALSVDAFCRAHDISRATFYKLKKDGRGPRVMRVGARTLISLECAAEWRDRMTVQSAAATPEIKHAA